MDRSKRAWLFAGLAFAPGVGLVRIVSEKVPLRPRLGRGSRILLVGDGMASGLGPPLGQMVRDQGMVLKVDARPATKITDWATKPWLRTLLAQPAPALTLISLGTNDAAPVETALPDKRAIGAIIEIVVAAGSYPIWIAPPKLPAPDRGIRDAIVNAPVEVFPSDALPLPQAPDGVHPTARGYAGWAGALWQWLRERAVAAPRDA